MHVRMPMQELAMSLNGGDHARYQVVSTQQATNFRLDAPPGATAELAQQLAIESSVQSQAFRDRQNYLPMGDRRAYFFGHVDGSQQGPFLVA